MERKCTNRRNQRGRLEAGLVGELGRHKLPGAESIVERRSLGDRLGLGDPNVGRLRVVADPDHRPRIEYCFLHDQMPRKHTCDSRVVRYAGWNLDIPHTKGLQPTTVGTVNSGINGGNESAEYAIDTIIGQRQPVLRGVRQASVFHVHTQGSGFDHGARSAHHMGHAQGTTTWICKDDMSAMPGYGTHIV